MRHDAKGTRCGTRGRHVRLIPGLLRTVMASTSVALGASVMTASRGHREGGAIALRRRTSFVAAVLGEAKCVGAIARRWRP